jgi:hypothetical protein
MTAISVVKYSNPDGATIEVVVAAFGTPSPGPRRLVEAPSRATRSPKGERNSGFERLAQL